MARKSKLTPQKMQELYNLVAAGNTHETAAALAGVGESTFYSWLQKGEDARSGKYRDFFDEMKRAKALAEAKRLEVIRKTAEGKNGYHQDWKAAAWLLERTNPEQWGRKDRIAADLNHRGEVTHNERTETIVEVRHQIEGNDDARDALKQAYDQFRAAKDGGTSNRMDSARRD